MNIPRCQKSGAFHIGIQKNLVIHILFGRFFFFFFFFFFFNPSFKIAVSGRAGWLGVWCRASSQVNLLVNLFSKLYVTFTLQWIAFIFGRMKRTTSRCVVCKRDNSHFVRYVLIYPDVGGLPFFG